MRATRQLPGACDRKWRGAGPPDSPCESGGFLGSERRRGSHNGFSYAHCVIECVEPRS